MKKLINGQSIRIDNHQRGDGQPVEWDNRIHIHKVMNKDRYNGAEIIIPIDPNIEITFRKVQGRSQSVEKQLMNEIQKAFEDSKKRQEFIIDVIKHLNRYAEKMPLGERMKELKDAANSIAKHLDLDEETSYEIERNAKEGILETLKTYTSTHLDKKGNTFYIIQDVERKDIKIGDNLDVLLDWEATMRLFK